MLQAAKSRRAISLSSAALAAALLASHPALAQTASQLSCNVPYAPDDGRLAICTGKVAPGHPVWTFVLRGRKPNIITRIEIYQLGKEKPRQVLEGFEVRPKLVPHDAVSAGQVDFVLQDANFDRLADLRIGIGPPDADGTAYRWFLFDRGTGKFKPTTALDRIRDPVINYRHRLVISAFHDARGRTGRIAFMWHSGKLVPVSARAREVTDYGRCYIAHYLFRDGKFQKTLQDRVHRRLRARGGIAAYAGAVSVPLQRRHFARTRRR